MTNKEWLDYLAHNAPDELAAWFDAERTESPTSATMQQIGQVIEDTVMRGVYGDTEPENADSRDKLEADVFKAADDMEMFYNGERFIDTRKIIGWLDRQAAITAEETSNAWEEYKDATQREIVELTAELDELQAALNDICANLSIIATGEPNVIADIAIETIDALIDQCNEYRSKFGKCLDYADAIHALMDDEGMA